jgi:hypothetical protein
MRNGVSFLLMVTGGGGHLRPPTFPAAQTLLTLLVACTRAIETEISLTKSAWALALCLSTPPHTLALLPVWDVNLHHLCKTPPRDSSFGGGEDLGGSCIGHASKSKVVHLFCWAFV